MDLNAHIASGLAALQRRDLKRAEASFQEVLTHAPSNAHALHFMGAVRQLEARHEEAEQFFRRATEAAPSDAGAHNSLGSLLASLGRNEEALLSFDRALGADPALKQARSNRALVLQRLGQHEAALEALMTITPVNASVLNSRGLSLKECGRVAEAEEAFSEAVAMQPDHFRAHHNLGNLLCADGRAGEAIKHYREAIRLAPKVADLRFAYATALYDVGDIEGADREFRTAIALKPDYIEAHEALNRLYWQHGQRHLHGKSYQVARNACPMSAPLYSAQARTLEVAGRPTEALAVVDEALRLLAPTPELLHRRARLRLAGEDEAGGFEDYAAAIDLAGDSAAAICLDRAKALTRLGRYEEALEDLARAEGTMPYDQELWAYRGLCWRLLGDEREAWLNDYDRFVQPFLIEVPEGYNSRETFLQDLRATLLSLHEKGAQPIDQSLRGGTQTNGSLLSRKEAVIVALRASLSRAVERYISALPDDPSHPFLSRKANGFAFSGSWSVLLRADGFHVNHVHPKGWISSAFYVGVPNTAGDAPHAGAIQFGESGAGLGPERETVARRIQPEAGMLVLFPSYMWHGTEAFTGADIRITTPFDVLPA